MAEAIRVHAVRQIVRRNPASRPSKFTTPTALAVVAELCRGGSLEAAAKSAGIGVSTLYRWLELGRRGDPRFSPLATAVPAATAAGRTRLSIGKFRAILNVMG
jgi:transposase-like protein